MALLWDKYAITENMRDSQESHALSVLDTDAERQQRHTPDFLNNEHERSDSAMIDRRDTKFLDGLRGVAALCVFNQHLTMSSTEHHHGFAENGHYYIISLPYIRIFYSGGAAAVAIFFVLSGFVLSQTTIELMRRGESQKSRYYLLGAVFRRPIRLYLPCFCITFVIALLMHLPIDVFPSGPWTHIQPSLIVEILNWFQETVHFFNPFHRHEWKYARYSYDTILWTIPIELKGSVLIYGLCALHRFVITSPFWFTTLLNITTVVLLQAGWWTGACFIGGLALSAINGHGLKSSQFSNARPWVKSSMFHALFFAGYYLLCQPALDGHREASAQTPGWTSLTSLIPRTYDDDEYYRFYHSYGAVLLIGALLHLHWLQRLLSIGIFQYLGRVSFMLYVLHWPILISLDRFRRAIGGGLPGTQSFWSDNLLHIPEIGPRGMSLRSILEWLLILPLTLSIAHLCTKYIDRPAVRLGRLFIEKFGLS